MKILTLNTGSSSLKYRLSEPDRESTLADGLIERIGAADSSISHEARGEHVTKSLPVADHRQAFDLMVGYLTSPERGVIQSLSEIAAVGHRVVHGGDKFFDSVEISDEVLRTIHEFEDLAPLHNPINLLGIAIARQFFPGIPHVAVFDTAFHQTMPRTAYLYAIPLELYDKHRIRRYGFHGTSHRYVSSRAARILRRPAAKLRMITCHLGNGCSMAAIRDGKSVDTSMGFTPLEGLVMGTRSGDIDPSIVFFLINKRGYDLEAVEEILNRKSGILGISGISNDMKTVIEASQEGDERARLALDIFAYRVKKYIGAYTAVLGGLDCLVFTAGIGERSPDVRRLICSDLEDLGIAIDPELNAKCIATEMVISRRNSPVKVVVVPTNEEQVIASETYRILSGKGGKIHEALRV